MGTRSLTVFHEDDGEEIVVMYRQMDGYPEGHGEQLAEFLKSIKLVNGISMAETHKVANGMPCLTAQVVAHFKQKPGDLYLHKSGTRDCGEEFIYTVYAKGGSVRLKVQAGSVTFFGMPGTKQTNMPALFDGPVTGFSAAQCKKIHDEVRDKIPNDFIEEKERSK